MITSAAAAHIPVMINEVVEALKPFDNGVFIDGTFGRGGYSEAILEAAASKVFGIDRDPAAITFGAEISRKYSGRLTIMEGCFGDIESIMETAGVSSVDGVAFDLGISSSQLDDAQRGFSFRFDGPLDMRMSRKGASAADLVNGSSEQELADIIHTLGEERQARRIAKAIVRTRSETPILTTGQLAEVVRQIVRKSKDGIDPATRTFMALRIRVNDELGELRRGLRAAENILSPGGRLAIVAFHSLEDRIVKEFLHSRSGRSGRSSRHLPEAPIEQQVPSFRLLKRGTVKAQASEVARNVRSRAARLRIAERTDSLPWSYQKLCKNVLILNEFGGKI